ncbi:MAG TPA: DUF2934 domain-containing protein [Candidatus Binatia bacterium]|nr:DUF2934 domain-containing protein [Candidatus Binatia bacterium]
MKARGKNGVARTREEIEALASQLWENNGRQPARAWDYWLQAECQLRSAHLSSQAARAAKLMILK